MRINALQTANYIIYYCNEHNITISNLKLQKLLYFVWVEYYKIKNDYLFSNKFFAWKFGPVVPSVYYEYCHYSGFPIVFDDYNKYNDELDEDLKETLDQCLKVNVHKSPSELVKMTHEPNTPWSEIFNDKNKGYNSIIPFELIINYINNNEGVYE